MDDYHLPRRMRAVQKDRWNAYRQRDQGGSTAGVVDVRVVELPVLVEGEHFQIVA